MQVLRRLTADATPISAYASHGAAGVLAAAGDGDARVHLLRFEPGGEIGPHEAGYGQLLIFTAGSGWAAGPDAERIELAAGDAVQVERGELHSKGSDTGATAVMVQLERLELRSQAAPPVIHGERVLLRPTTIEDVERLTEILLSPEIVEWWPRYDADRVEDELVGEPTFAVELDGTVIGLIAYWEQNEPEYRYAGVDVTLHPDWHGQGLGADAVRAMARHLFEVRGHHRITIDPEARNAKAIRCYESVGFRRVGVMRSYGLGADGEWADGLLMDMLAGELR